jgi:hypothetical protein
MISHAGPFVPYKELLANIGFTEETGRAAATATPKE